MPELFLLPTGDTTRNKEHYLDAWEAVVKPFSKLAGVNHCIIERNEYNLKFITKDGSFSIPVSVLMTFNRNLMILGKVRAQKRK